MKLNEVLGMDAMEFRATLESKNLIQNLRDRLSSENTIIRIKENEKASKFSPHLECRTIDYVVTYYFDDYEILRVPISRDYEANRYRDMPNSCPVQTGVRQRVPRQNVDGLLKALKPEILQSIMIEYMDIEFKRPPRVVEDNRSPLQVSNDISTLEICTKNMRATLQLMERIKDPNLEDALVDLHRAIMAIEKQLSWEYDALSHGEYDEPEEAPPTKK